MYLDPDFAYLVLLSPIGTPELERLSTASLLDSPHAFKPEHQVGSVPPHKTVGPEGRREMTEFTYSYFLSD